jgi:hypothetical protein
MWIAIAALTVVVVFLLLAVLGAMREVVVLRGDVKAFTDLVQRPPAPTFVAERDRVPAALSKRLPHATESSERHLVAFLSPGCQPCQDLASGLSAAVEEGHLAREQLTVVVWAFTHPEAERFASQIALPCILDGDGKLSRLCEVRATPTLFIVSADNHKVLDYSPEGSTEWVISRMKGPALTATAA